MRTVEITAAGHGWFRVCQAWSRGPEIWTRPTGRATIRTASLPLITCPKVGTQRSTVPSWGHCQQTVTGGTLTTTVLLGAGASKGADIPISAEMTAALLDKIDPGSRALLHFVYGGLLMQMATKAHSAGYSRRPIVVDAEDLFNAVEALANRATFDVAPFVASWHPLIDQFDKYRPDDLEREIKAGLGQLTAPFGADNFARTLARVISRGTRNNRFQQVATDTRLSHFCRVPCLGCRGERGQFPVLGPA